MINFGNIFIKIGIFLIILGLIINFLPKKFPFLPGDIFYQKDNFTFYFPLATSIIISLLLTLIVNLFK
ncbi:MAG: DUF2905 domain-containing protein [Patescibacteria group bacterium]|nr:DUF2905 domain-containing protein [Patescibacteria group bacterium]